MAHDKKLSHQIISSHKTMNRQDLLDLHDETSAKCKAIMERKNNDYSGGKSASDDPFANFKMSQVVGIHPVTGLLLRVMDKIQRIRTFTLDDELAVSDESVEDACDDIVNYAILCKGLLRESRQAIRKDQDPDPTFLDNLSGEDLDWIEERIWGLETGEPKKYRLLEQGERVEWGDEFFYSAQNKWIYSVAAGTVVERMDEGYYRRPI